MLLCKKSMSPDVSSALILIWYLTVFVAMVTQDDEGSVGLHPESDRSLQADSPTNSEASSGHTDVYVHEPPAGGGAGKHNSL